MQSCHSARPHWRLRQRWSMLWLQIDDLFDTPASEQCRVDWNGRRPTWHRVELTTWQSWCHRCDRRNAAELLPAFGWNLHWHPSRWATARSSGVPWSTRHAKALCRRWLQCWHLKRISTNPLATCLCLPISGTSSNASTTLKCPFWHAMYSGVEPSSVDAEFMRIDGKANKRRTISVLPFWHATNSAVVPSSHFALGLANIVVRTHCYDLNFVP